MQGNGLTIWAESPEEARIFIDKAYNNGFRHFISAIYVAKRSPKNRSNDYVDGEYYCTSNDPLNIQVYTTVIVAPPAIIALVQWCTCDIMISRGDIPIAVLEDTTHMVRMNVYQRVPRLFRAAILGVPALCLQGTRGLNFDLRGDCWAMHRYIRAFAAISRLHPNTAVLPFCYIPTQAGDEAAKERMAFEYLDALVTGDVVRAQEIRRSAIAELNDISTNGYLGQIAPDINSIEVLPHAVTVHIGAKPDVKSWEAKGSGQMDPYIGMIAAAKYIYCFDAIGAQVRKMRVRFTFLKPDFWWFQNYQTSRSLYKTLAFQIADEVEFAG
ncbi:hypothetical protein [Burkholderia gladioli]|uniref:hypothetical protein n=1 Tax=Burkholderia gladioli TaxID=28095 RepID=UPI00163E00E0|nr:hypothetical protein [Burkholderia gladioli]